MMMMKVPSFTVAGVELREGATFTWQNFGGIAWTGRGAIVALVLGEPFMPGTGRFLFTGTYEGVIVEEELPARPIPLELRILAARFERSAEIDLWRASPRSPSRDVLLNVAPPAVGYPFGDGDGPVFFAGDAVECAIMRGWLVIDGSGIMRQTGHKSEQECAAYPGKSEGKR